ncbi:unnamed protein product [Schistosoma margrebowiei]|uniref:Uncharacterized protein n=1 Tax=Schistosoma margrebowiei TaxID=48269 RepID=A0A183MM22_9TREM|nr:unnamed protein product [Schistosoma margrebowiei]
MKEALTSTYQEVLSHNRHHHNEWISIGTLDKIHKRKKKTVINNSRTRSKEIKAQTKYTDANKQVKKSIRHDRQKYMEYQATVVEKATTDGNIKQLYDTTKKLVRKYGKPERPVKDKDGKPITEIQEQRNKWVARIE